MFFWGAVNFLNYPGPQVATHTLVLQIALALICQIFSLKKKSSFGVSMWVQLSSPEEVWHEATFITGNKASYLCLPMNVFPNGTLVLPIFPVL